MSAGISFFRRSLKGKSNMGKKSNLNGKKNDVSFDDYLALQKELDETRKKYGVEVKEGRISRAISNFFDRRESREPSIVVRKKVSASCSIYRLDGRAPLLCETISHGNLISPVFLVRISHCYDID